MEILLAFLRLGLTSFGGPVAHLGYFRAAFVERLGWLDEPSFAEIVAFCSFLPGPTSSQVGFAIGLHRGGSRGGLLAWLGFTMPSAILMFLLAQHARALGVLRGLTIVAVAVVGQALIGMARTLAPEWRRRLIAAAAAAIVFLSPGGQVAAIAFGALAGAATGPREARTGGRRATPGWGSIGCLASFGCLLALPLLVGRPDSGVALFDAFAQAGALVFGGGHVVLPLLQSRVVGAGWVSQSDFLAGYGAAQAMPGPLFAFATYLGAIGRGVPHGLAGAAIATLAIFAPGLLLTAGLLPFWGFLRRLPSAAAAIEGCGAAVVGVLAAAFWTPVISTGVRGPADAAAALAGLLLLVVWRCPPLVVVGLGLIFGLAGNLA